VTSRTSIDTKSDAVQAFHDAWYEALKLMIDSPEEGGRAITEWGRADWTRIAQPADLQTQLGKLAQATLGSNQLAFNAPETLVSRLTEARRIWAQSGLQLNDIDFNLLVDGRFTLASAASGNLFSARPPVNNTFLLTARVQAPPQSASGGQPIAVLPLDFESDAVRLTSQAVQDLTEKVLPILRDSNLSMRISGSSAWPGPEGRYSEAEIEQFAQERALTVASFLTQQGIDPNRLLTDTIDSKYPYSLDERELAQDRIVRFTIVGGR
jgi:hypothetical protein